MWLVTVVRVNSRTGMYVGNHRTSQKQKCSSVAALFIAVRENWSHSKQNVQSAGMRFIRHVTLYFRMLKQISLYVHCQLFSCGLTAELLKPLSLLIVVPCKDLSVAY